MAEGQRTYSVLPEAKPTVLVVHCGDPRFLGAIKQFLQDEHGLSDGDYIPFVPPGSVAQLSLPNARPKDFKVAREGIEFYLTHVASVRKVILINHEDCKKYGALVALPQFLFGMKNVSERQRHDLQWASGVLEKLSGRPLEMKKYYLKYSNPEHTEAVFNEV